MKTNLIYSAVIVFSMAVISCTSGGKEREADEALLKVLEVSGTQASIDEMDAHLKKYVDSNLPVTSSTEEQKKFFEKMKSRSGTAETQKNILQYMREHTNKDSLEKVIEVYKKPLFQKIADLEASNEKASKREDRKLFMEQLKANPIAQQRAEQLIRLDIALGETERETKVLKKHYQMLIDKYGVQALPSDFYERDEAYVVKKNAYIYRTLSDEEIEAYISFLTSPLGVYYRTEKLNAFEYAKGISFKKAGRMKG